LTFTAEQEAEGSDRSTQPEWAELIAMILLMQLPTRIFLSTLICVASSPERTGAITLGPQ